MNRNRRSNNYYLLHFGGSIQANSFHFIAVHKASNNLIHPSKLIPSFSSNNFGFPQLCYTDGFYAAVCHQLGNNRKMISDIYPFTQQIDGWTRVDHSKGNATRNIFFLETDLVRWHVPDFPIKTIIRQGPNRQEKHTVTPVPPTESSTFLLSFLFFAFSKSLSNRAKT